jgi:hypothetical protein
VTCTRMPVFSQRFGKLVYENISESHDIYIYIYICTDVYNVSIWFMNQMSWFTLLTKNHFIQNYQSISSCYCKHKIGIKRIGSL